MNASARPSSSATACTASAPIFDSAPGTSRISQVSALRVPATYDGCARIASATRRSAVPGSARTKWRKERASPVRLMAISGAPQPSVPTAVTRSPDVSSTTVATSRCNGWDGSRYVSSGQPLRTQAASIAACLPEQFMVTRSRMRPAARYASASTRSSGRSAGFSRSSAVSPDSASIFCTRARWKSSPEWLAAANASRSPDSSTPARSTAAAWRGLLLERGKTGTSGSPSANSTLPSAASSTSEPRCLPSTKPDRTISARTGD